MNLNEAYSLLGLKMGASQDDAQKSFKKLAIKFHPDRNKGNEEEAEKKFKKINEALQTIKSGKAQQSQFKQNQPEVKRRTRIMRSDPFIEIDISFKEAINGTSKDINYKRYIKCDDCQGRGEIKTVNSCNNCGGRGRVTQSSGFFQFNSVCTFCFGTGREFADCLKCKTNGDLERETSLKVKIPPGIRDGQSVSLSRVGNYVYNKNFLGDLYRDVLVKVNVSEEHNMWLEGDNVISTLDLDLVDAIRGDSFEVKTLDGHRNISVPAMSKHKDRIELQGKGVAGKGSHIFELNIEYPEDLLKKLEKEE